MLAALPQAYAVAFRCRGELMASTPKQVQVAAAWVGAEDLPLQFANAFGGIVGPNAVFLNIGSVVPPGISGMTEQEREEQIRSLTYVPIRPIARIAMSPKGLDELIAILEETRKNYENLTSALGEQERT
jgi:hypothetical protein